MPEVVGRTWDGAKVYAVDRVDSPLTPGMAQDLREGRASSHLIARGLAQNPAPFIPPRADDDPWPLTHEGARIRKLLGSIPPEYIKPIRFNGRVVDREYDTRYCPSCRKFVDARATAWGHPAETCVNCAGGGA